MAFSKFSALPAALLFLVACGNSDEGVGPEDVESAQEEGEGATDEGESSEEGEDEGSAEPVLGTDFELVEIFNAPAAFFCFPSGCRPGLAVDLEFNPVRPSELWVLYRQPYDGVPCEESNRASCDQLGSQVAIISDADTDSPSVDVKEDGNAWHFMRLGTALAFADDDSFATVGEARTGNFMDNPVDFMGPTWWSSNPAIFAQDFELNGSHLDMLHATPFGMGIAHDPTRWGADGELGTGPIFWAFNGDIGSVDRYDFKEPHTPGGEDHSDGTMHRYVEGELKMAQGVPSHMEFGNLGKVPAREGLFGPSLSEGGEQDDWWLYIADSGHRRIVRLDTKSGSLGGSVLTPDPQLADPRAVDGAVLEEVIPEGVLPGPTGLAIDGERLIITDTATSQIHVFDLEGNEQRVFNTELPMWSLAGVAVGPDGNIYFVDWNEGRVLRLEER